MLKIPLLGLTTVAVFSAVVLGAEQKEECIVPIKSVAREIASYLDNVSLVDLSSVDRIMHWECRNELALRLSGEEAMMGQAHPIDFIRCNDECTLLKWMDHYADSNKRAALTLNGHCHLVRGMPITLDPMYNGEYNVKSRIQCGKFPVLNANLSKRGQWITYTNKDNEWIARKLNDDLVMENEINLKQPSRQYFRIVGSNYAISQAWTKDIGATFKLYEFSEQSGVGDVIGTATVPPRSNPVIRESGDGGLPKIVYVKTEEENANNNDEDDEDKDDKGDKNDKDKKLTHTVHTQSFIDGEYSSERVIDSAGTGITPDFINSLTRDGKYVITTADQNAHSDRFTVSDAVTGEIKIKCKVPFEKFIQDSEKDHKVQSSLTHNDRYCLVCSIVTVLGSDGDYEGRFNVNGFFDLKTGEQMGPFFTGSNPWKWASLDLLFFQDEKRRLYLRSVHSPQAQIPFQMPDQCNLYTHGYYAFPRDRDRHELSFLDWKKSHQL